MMKAMVLIIGVGLLLMSTTLFGGHGDESATIAEHLLIPACRPLFNDQHMRLQKYLFVFKNITQLVVQYPQHRNSLLGSVIDILRNLPENNYAHVIRALEALSGSDGFLHDVLYELNRYE